MATPRPLPDTPSLCILRLSAIGDCCHVVPLVHALRRHRPQARITWIIGRSEARLLSLLPDVELIAIDKRQGWRSRRQLWRALAGRRFDALLMLQPSLRASLYSLQISAARRIGWDRARARELQWLFSNEAIQPAMDQHVLDTTVSFARALGTAPEPLCFDLAPRPDDLAWAAAQIPQAGRALIISASASHPWRNWSAARYAAVARHAVNRLGLQVLLCGAPTAAERELAAGIEAQAGVPLRSLVGQDTLPRLLALLGRAAALLSPDSGPAHMATLAGTPVIGLYAATRSARTGPYRSRESCVDRYAEAARRFRGCEPDALHWNEDITDAGVMDLIGIDDVTAKLDALMNAVQQDATRRQV